MDNRLLLTIGKSAGDYPFIHSSIYPLIRCIALDAAEEEGACMVTGQPSKQRVHFARAY